jgi:magnesium transporter
MVSRIPTAKSGERVGAVRERLPGAVFDVVETVCVVDGAGVLRGTVRLAVLFAAPAGARVEKVMVPAPATVLPETDQERVAGTALEHGLVAVPVVDARGVLLGLVPPSALLVILRREHVEDLQRFTGILDGAETAREALESSPLRRARHRLPWLLVGLAGSFFATYLVTRFERVLVDRVAVAFFVPGLVYMADAIGTQSEAVAVRGLSFTNNSLRRLVTSELLTGGLIGLVLSLLTFPAVLLAFGDPFLAGAVALSLLAAGCSAATVGLFFPWLLSRLGTDPAFGSGPLATIFQDIFSLLVYFTVVAWLIR